MVRHRRAERSPGEQDPSPTRCLSCPGRRVVLCGLCIQRSLSSVSPLLEAPAATVTLVALLLLTRAPKAGPVDSVVLTAGALLGVSAGLEIWGVVVVVAVLRWTVGALAARDEVSCC